ncbi:FAD-dependent oxidoreductase [Actinoplanes sp. DH11]|uniref:FAD-dependent oxidoreductase n=1 Tax=Actinoplanes sp. DH11 TaxID=2857011 RepID=UPI001E36AD32|nr:FAD-dependent oxidoreductase [Actinoplanes sp. DH11]
MERTIGIVGGGIVGLAVGREIARRRPGTRVVVLEKETEVARHQTGHNSGVVHAGLYYPPGSLKADLCARGRVLLRDYCAERGIAYEACGKLVVAVRADELGRLDELARRARANGVPGLGRLGPAGIREIEPYATGLAAVHSPETAITDFPGVARAFADDVRAAGLVRGLIYPVPDPRYPFLGVHFTRRVTGDLEVGPNAVLAGAREGYRRGRISVPDLAGIAAWPGTWRMARRHWRTGVREVAGSLSKRRYMAGAMRYVPEIGAADVVRAGAGVRAQALDRDGSLVDDFRIHRLGAVTAVRNAPSPAATSCLAIAWHVVSRLP